MSYTQLVQGTCGRCGIVNRVLMPPGTDGLCCCKVCALFTKLQHMTARIDSDSDFRYLRLYRDLQEAAQRFWITPPEMSLHFATNTAPEMSIRPTPILPATSTIASPMHTATADPTLPSIIPPSPENADPRDPNWGPHRMAASAPSITVPALTYNRFSRGTAEHTRNMSQIRIPTDWQVTPRPGEIVDYTPLYCPPSGTPCRFYTIQPIGYACTAFASHMCPACFIIICPGHSADCTQCGIGPLCHFCVRTSAVARSLPFHG